MTPGSKRAKPNVMITGTPGTGKTTVARALSEATDLRHISIGDLVKEKQLFEEWDSELDCHVIDEDKVIDEIDAMMRDGGNTVDYHGCDFFPEDWFDLVVVLQTDLFVLDARLNARNYSPKKISNNMDCEIFQVLLEEAKESYSDSIIYHLRNDNAEDLSKNVSFLTEKLKNWNKSN